MTLNKNDGHESRDNNEVSAASLEKPRRRRNLLVLLVLLAFVVLVYFASFTHIGEETDPRPETGTEQSG